MISQRTRWPHSRQWPCISHRSSALPHNVGVVGATGRLGRVICDLASEMGCSVTLFGSTSEWITHRTPETIIDVSHASAFADVVRFCSTRSTALVEGVSTLSRDQ